MKIMHYIRQKMLPHSLSRGNSKKRGTYLLPILSSLLMGTSYIPFPPWAVFFCYIPLWHFALKQDRLKPLLIGGWLCQFIFSLITSNWVGFTMKEFGFFPWPIAIIGLLGFASFANLHIPIALVIWFYVQKISKEKFPWEKWLWLPILFALSQRYYPTIFDWNFGYTWFYINLPSAQTAEIWGFQFIHTLILLSNLLFLFVFKNIKNNRGIIALGLWLTSFIFLQCWGWYLKNRWPAPDQTAQVLLVQPNIQNNMQRNYKTKPELLYKLIFLTKKQLLQKLSSNIDFILWPEGGYPYPIRTSSLQSQKGKTRIQKIVKALQRPLVLSATAIEDEGPYTSLFTFNQKGELAAPPYHKTRLLIFGEYWPGEKWLPVHKLLSYYGRSFLRGRGDYKVTPLHHINLGFQICYEGIFDDITRDLARQNAHILVNVTNDSWFGYWQEPWQHLYMTMARAIEVRRPLIRGTNTGFSAIISAHGDFQFPPTAHSFGTSWTGIYPVPYSTNNQKKSLFSSWGFYINGNVLWTMFFYLLVIGRFPSFFLPSPMTAKTKS